MTKTSTIIGSIFLGLIFALPVFGAVSLQGYGRMTSTSTIDFSSNNVLFKTDVNCIAGGVPDMTLCIKNYNVYSGIYPDLTKNTGDGSGRFAWSQLNNFHIENYYSYGYGYNFNGEWSIVFILQPIVSGNFSGATSSLYVKLNRTGTAPDINKINAVWNSLSYGGIVPTSTAPDINNYGFANQDFGLVGNYFRDVLVFLFVPSPESLQKFSDLKTTLESKAPFAYFFSIRNSLNSLSASSSPIFELQDSGVFDNDIFVSIKNGLIWIFWIMFAFWVIRKISDFNF